MLLKRETESRERENGGWENGRWELNRDFEGSKLGFVPIFHFPVPVPRACTLFWLNSREL